MTYDPTIAPRVIVTHTGVGQAFIVARATGPSDPTARAEDWYAQIGDVLRRSRMEIVHERIFGSLDVELEVRTARRAALSAKGIVHETAITYVEGLPSWGRGLAGVIIHAVSGGTAEENVWTIRDGDLPCGKGWKRNNATYLVLQNVQATEQGLDAPDALATQATRMIERAARLLAQQGATYRNVVRTWFYLSHILNWYDAFNRARNAIYRELNVLPGSEPPHLPIPASTGIGSNYPPGRAGALDLFAMVSASEGRPRIAAMFNPRQRVPLHYGSAFSRGIVIDEPNLRFVHVSGTAAIDQVGKSLYPGDVYRQIVCTLENVEALISQAGAQLADIAAATVFVKRPEYAPIFWAIAQERGLGQLPGVTVVADICRDELLFEIDAEVALIQS